MSPFLNARAYLEVTLGHGRLLKVKRDRRHLYIRLAAEDGTEYWFGIWTRPDNTGMFPYLEGLFPLMVTR